MVRRHVKAVAVNAARVVAKADKVAVVRRDKTAKATAFLKFSSKYSFSSVGEPNARNKS